LPLPTAELQLFPTTGASWSAHLPHSARQVGTGHRAFRAVRTHARHGPHQLRDDLNRFTFLLGGSDGERLFGP
jgi:hypothetical protein